MIPNNKQVAFGHNPVDGSEVVRVPVVRVAAVAAVVSVVVSVIVSGVVVVMSIGV